MPVTVVLAIGFDPWLFESQRATWQSSGHFVTSAGSTGEALHHFRDGDFDAVLLGRSIPAKAKEQIISQIRASGSTVPVVCVAEPASKCEVCEFALTSSEPLALMQRIEELLAAQSRKPPASAGETSDAMGPLVRAPATGFSRSGVRRRSQRAAQARGQIVPLLQFAGVDSPCFSIRFQAAVDTRAGFGGAVPAGKINYSQA